MAKKKEKKLVEMYMRLKSPRPNTGKKIMSMNLGNTVVGPDYKLVDVDPDMLESKQCKHWMDVSKEKPEDMKETEAKVKSKKERAKRVAKATSEGKLAPEGKRVK